MLRILCFHCGHEFQAADSVLNHVVTCGKCGTQFVADDIVTARMTPPPPPVVPPPIALAPLAESVRSTNPQRSIYKRLIVILTILWLPACAAMYVYRIGVVNRSSPPDDLLIAAVRSFSDDRYIANGPLVVTAAYGVAVVALIMLHFATRPDR